MLFYTQSHGLVLARYIQKIKSSLESGCGVAKL